MASITNEEIRCRVLDILYKTPMEESSVFGVHRSVIQEALKVRDRDLDYNMAYLARNNLVELIRAHDIMWLWAKITVLGRDIIENKEKYSERFPFLLSAKQE
ncbi:MAG: hypothetical protein NWF14_07715 [Candidatus Bathyarchaeota archaeon]|nr:hypothetical protein [Candidatus Bathyarchaeota archaeon]